jgi:hypothetical protein
MAALEVKLIDFAHSFGVPSRTLSHREQWMPGSDEDDIGLLEIEKLEKCFTPLAAIPNSLLHP